MIKKFVYAMISSVVFYCISYFVVCQFLFMQSNVNSIHDITLTYDFSILQQKQYQPIITVLIMLSILLFIWMLIKDIGIQKSKSKYEKKSYNKLLTRYQRKRGTVRVQYDDNGNITRNTLECFYDNLMKPITRLQNKICFHYHLPESKRWNTVHDFKNPDGSIRHHTSGIPVVAYRKYFLWGKFNRLNLIFNVIHALFIGMSGKGKSETFVLPMINSNIDAGESMFVHDPKRELLARTREKLEEEGYKVIVIDFVSPEESDGWNPLQFAYDRWKKAVDKTVSKDYRDADLSEAIELVLDISKTISFQEDAQNPFWHEGAGDMIAAGAYFAMEEGIEEYVNFTTINYLYQLGEKDDVLGKFLEKYRTPEDQSVLKMDTYRSAEGVTKSGLKATFKNKMSILTATPAIQKLLGSNTFSWDKVFEQKTAIFMVTHDEKSTYYPLVTIFIKQLYESMIKWTRDHRAEFHNKLKIPWHLYIDEMGLLPEIKDIEAMFGAGRSRGMHMYCFFQSFAQLVQKYEVEGAKIIQDNSTHTIYLGSKLKEVADDFEKIAGNELYYNRNSKTWEERPVITSERLQLFERGRSLVTALEWNPYVSKLPPYSQYTFAREANFKSKKIAKPPVRWFNIQEEYEKRKIKKFQEKGAKPINFQSLKAE